jgi:hypothetical protein
VRLQSVYESARLYVNFFQPSFKLASKQRDGALVRKRYHPPLAPYQRLLACDRIDETIKQRLREQFAALDPVALLTTIRAAQQELSILTNRDAGAAGSPDQPEYLAAFATAWHSDYRAPKGQRKTTTKHWWRSRADPQTEMIDAAQSPVPCPSPYSSSRPTGRHCMAPNTKFPTRSMDPRCTTFHGLRIVKSKRQSSPAPPR